MMGRKPVIVVILALVSPIRLLFAQGDPCLRRIVPVNVSTEEGMMVSGLTANDFRASFHNEPVKIVSVKPNTSTPRVMIVIDASGSMTASKTDWNYNLQVAHALLGYMPAGAMAGLVVFSGKVETEIPPTKDLGRLSAELDHLKGARDGFPTPRSTALWDSLHAVASYFDPPQIGDSIYALTDAGDNSSRIHGETLRNALLTRGIRLFTFSLNMEFGERTPEELKGAMYMQDLVDSTGGYAVSISPRPIRSYPGKIPEPPSEAPHLLLAQTRRILTYYEVELELPERFDKARDWRLKTRGMDQRDQAVVYPRKLAPCSAPAIAANPIR